MKKFNFFVVMMLGVFTIGFMSCEEEDPQPTGKKLVYGDSLSVELIKVINYYAYEQMARINDTLWPLDANGLPYRERHPVTGEWIHNGIKLVEVTLAEQLVKLGFKSAEELVKERGRTIIFFDQNPNEKIYVEFPNDARILGRTTEDGKVFKTEMLALNDVRQTLVDNPNLYMSQVITNIHNAAQPTLTKACKEDYVAKLLNPTTKSAIQIANYDLVMEEIIYLVEKGVKPDQKLIDKLAQKLMISES